jgi:O-antigen/teichoic acid export membrane protein
MGGRSRLASRSAIIFGFRIFGAALILLTQALMAKLWGAELLGHYLLIISAVNLLATVMPLGFQVVAGYFAAEYLAYEARPALRAFTLRAYGHIAAVALILGALGCIWSGFTTETNDVVRELWVPSLLCATAVAIVFVNGGVLVGLRRPVAGFAIDTFVRPALILVGFGLALKFSGDISPLRPMLWIFAITYLSVALWQVTTILKLIETVPVKSPSHSEGPARWWRLAFPWMIITLATDFFFEIDLLLLAPVLSADELAVFGVCTRVFSLCAFGVAAVYATTMPDILEAGARKNEREFRRKIGDANLIATILASAMAVAALATGPVFAFVFGAPFAAAAIPLSLLCGGLAVRSIMGPGALILSFRDRPYACLPAVGLGLCSLVAANMVLVPAFGLHGAALAALVAMSIWSASIWATTRRDTQLDVSILPRIREILARRDRNPRRSGAPLSSNHVADLQPQQTQAAHADTLVVAFDRFVERTLE